MKRTACVLIALVFALNIYRAAVQSCTIDEATTYNEYASKSITEILTLPFDANNHVLHTILCRWAVRTLGVSELTLRIPSLLGGLLFLVMSYRLCRLYFGRGWLFLTVFSALALNPFTLDYLSIARGYGLAAGLFLVACLQPTRHLLESAWNPRRLLRASFALGAAVAANLTFAVPAVALVLVFLQLEMWERRRLRVWDAINQLILPGTVASAVILLLPLTRASRDVFYFGAKTIRQSIDSFAVPTFTHHATPLAWFGGWLHAEALLIVSIATLLMAVSMLLATRGTLESFPQRMPLLLTGGTLTFSAAMLIAAHATAGMLYPFARTGLYLVALFTLALGAAALQYRASVRSAAVFLATPFLLLFLAQITAGPYHMWLFDSSTKTIVKFIRADALLFRDQPIRIAANPFLQPTINFYRRRYHLNQVAHVDGDSLSHPADYYVLLPENLPIIEQKQLHVVYRDALTSVILAKPKVLH